MRAALYQDVEPVMAALIRMKDRSPAAQMKFTDPEVARRYIVRQIKDNKAVIHKGYFILFDVGSPWYSDQDFLIEDIIIRIFDTDTPVSEAIDALSVIAKERGCVAVTVGDTQIGHMVPLYHAAGFVTLGQQLIKEI